MDKNNIGTIMDDEVKELSELVDAGNRLMLRKARAAALLTERGYDLNKPTTL